MISPAPQTMVARVTNSFSLKLVSEFSLYTRRMRWIASAVWIWLNFNGGLYGMNLVICLPAIKEDGVKITEDSK